jgi:hypothetical protein
MPCWNILNKNVADVRVDCIKISMFKLIETINMLKLIDGHALYTFLGTWFIYLFLNFSKPEKTRLLFVFVISLWKQLWLICPCVWFILVEQLVDNLNLGCFPEMTFICLNGRILLRSCNYMISKLLQVKCLLYLSSIVRLVVTVLMALPQHSQRYLVIQRDLQFRQVL